MAQVGVLGSLQYVSAAHSWALDLGWLVSSFKVPTAHRNTTSTIRQINRVLNLHEIDYNIPAITEGEAPDFWQVLSDILDLVGTDPALGAFFLIGSAACLLDIASRYTGPWTDELRSVAKICIFEIYRRSEDLQVNAEALNELLAEPPFDPVALRRKLRRVSQPLVILFLFADPSNAPRRGFLDEKRTLGEIVATTVVSKALQVVDVPGCRINDISDALLRYEPTLLHFSGHGTQKGEFCFQTEHGETANVKAQALANLLGLARENGLKGAVMNAGYSAGDAQLLADAMGYAIAMEGRLSDQDAKTFTRQFYGALGSGKPFDKAFEWAVAGAGLDPAASGLRPKLFKGRRDITTDEERSFSEGGDMSKVTYGSKQWALALSKPRESRGYQGKVQGRFQCYAWQARSGRAAPLSEGQASTAGQSLARRSWYNDDPPKMPLASASQQMVR